MTRTKRQKYDARMQLRQLGVREEHANQLLRIANRLHRWHELECGVEWGGIYRGDDGKLLQYTARDGKTRPYHGRDYETAALRRLGRIMDDYPQLEPYVQGDPRGCALYVLRPGDVPQGENADAYYSRGIAIYKE